MADVATTPAVEGEKKGLVKPEKPDEDVYKNALKNAEKEHADSMAKFVSTNRICRIRLQSSATRIKYIFTNIFTTTERYPS